MADKCEVCGKGAGLITSGMFAGSPMTVDYCDACSKDLCNSCFTGECSDSDTGKHVGHCDDCEATIQGATGKCKDCRCATD